MSVKVYYSCSFLPFIGDCGDRFIDFPPPLPRFAWKLYRRLDESGAADSAGNSSALAPVPQWDLSAAGQVMNASRFW